MATKKKKIKLKDSGVIFNAENHTYLLGDKFLSGITPVLQRQLFPTEFEGIPKHIVDAAAEYGTEVHAACEDFDANWNNDGTVEVQDYIQICHEYNLTHEASEYTVTNGKDYASQIDKVYRVSDDTFDLGDIKTYGQMTAEKQEKARWQLSVYAMLFERQNRGAKVGMTAEKQEKARWQLSVYAMLFERQNRGAKVGRLFIIHLRNKQKKDGTFDHISEIIFVNRIPSEICEDLLATDLRGEQFINPYGIPEEYRSKETIIRELIQTKAAIEEKLNGIKAKILKDMELKNVRTWATDTMRLTRKLPTQRSSFNLALFKTDHPEYDYDQYMRVSEVAGSLSIAV